MNLNELVINRGRGRGKKNRGKTNNAFGVSKMGPPLSATVRKKASSSSSDLNWGRSHISVLNTPSTIQKSIGSSKISSEEDSRVIVALTEGRGEARCEVGIAAISVSKPLLVLCQISDTQSYINTLTKINIFNPQEILIPATFIENFSGNRLIDIVKEKFPNVKYTGVPRSTFNKVNGMEILSDICIPSLNAILLVLQHRYYALAAASALITFVQNNLYIYYAGGSIKIDYQESEGYAIIDVSTADRLELVCSAKPAQGNKYSSLFGVLNHCVTKIGARTLRSTILQPPCDVQYIEERLNCVAELIKHPEMLLSIQALLQKVSNVDLLLSIGTIVPVEPQKCSNRQLNYILLLNSLADLVAPLKEVLSKSGQPFFVQLRNTLESEEFTTIRDIVRTTIQENAHPAKGQAGIMQRCFAIKPGINGLLDLVRKVYSERIDDMREYVKGLAEKYDLALTPGNNQTKGHHIVLNLNQKQKRYMKKSDLPEEFIQVYRLAGSFTMKTPELVNFSTRLEDIMADILRISNVMVHSIIIEIKKYVSLFYKLCEEIANLDVLQSLAETSVRNGYVRPEFGDFTEVTFGHHPLLDFLLPTKPISNPISCSSDVNVHIITGPNGSGKSIFIREVVLLQVMAQMGCYVPAQTAVFRPADRMYARIYLEDNMEYGASSFILEMKEIKYIMTTMTENSLIIIDELCRSTSLEEGTALAIAVVEKMAQSSAFIYITTHFTLLTKLYDMYLNVKLWQLETIPSGEDPKTFKLDFKYNLIPGVTSVKRYGVYIVRNIWSDSILKYVDELLDKITKKPLDPKIIPIDEKVRLKYNVESQFRKLKSRHKLTVAQVNKLLNQYQNNLRKLGYEINVLPLSRVDSFTENIDTNLPQFRHSIFDRTQYFPEYNQSHVEEDLYSTDERMKHIFTPEALSLSQISISDPEARMTEERLKNIFTPEQSQISNNCSLQNYPNVIPCQDYHDSTKLDFSDSSSYRNISKFIGEDLENIHKLIPEVNVSYEKTPSPSQSNSNISQDPFDNCGTDPISKQPTNTVNLSHKFVEPQPRVQLNRNITENQHLENNYDGTSSIDISKDMNDFRFSIPLRNDVAKTSTPVKRRDSHLSQSSSPVVHIYSQRRNFSIPSSNNLDFNYNPHKTAQSSVDHSNTFDAINLESLQDDLEVCSKIFAESDDDFEAESLNTIDTLSSSSKNNPQEEVQIKRFPHQNIMPKVTIIEGPNNTTLSIDEDDLKEESSAIQKPQVKINVISDIVITASGNIKAKDQQEQSIEREHDLQISANQSDSADIDANEKTFQTENESQISVRSNGDQSKGSCKTDGELFTNYRNIQRIASDYSNNSFKSGSSKSDNTAIEFATELANEEHVHNPANDSYKSIVEHGKFQTEPTKSKDLDESYKSLEDNSGNLYSCNSETNIELYENLNDLYELRKPDSPSATNREPKESKCNVNNYEPAMMDHNKFDAPIDKFIAEESCILNGKSVEEERRVNPTTNLTTSISNASKLRNLDQVTSDSSTHEASGSKKTSPTNNDKSITSTSSASRKRNLDDITTTSSPSGGSNKKLVCKTMATDKFETTNSQKENDVGELKINKDSSVHEESVTKSTTSTNNNDKYVTSISSASNKRNLDNITTTSSEEFISETKATDKFETTSSQKETDISLPNRNKVARKQFSKPRNAETKKSDKNPQTSKTLKKTNKNNQSYANKRKFVPPRKLSAKEIREEFREQDRRILESSPSSSNYSKYLEQMIKRPSVKQIQNTTHLALIRKTHEGVEVIPAEPTRKKRKRSPLKRHFSNENFNVSIFSDKNAVPFENYLKSNVKDYKTFNFNFGAKQENAPQEKFKFEPTTERLGEYTNNSVTRSFVRTSSEIVKNNEIWCQEENINATLIRRNFEASQNTQLCPSQQSMNQSLTPEGFYKQNKDEITRILNKYLESSIQSSQQAGRIFPNRGADRKRSIFENADLSTSDLNI